MPDQPTLSSALDRALVAYERLAEVGEVIDDEWSYIADLRAAWTEHLQGIAAMRGEEPVPPHVDEALSAAIGEIDRIEDPHRAIDWLSTFPQVVCLAIGERP